MTKVKSKNNYLAKFLEMKQQGEKICMLTAYDYAMAKCVSATSVDLILVGDSLGMVVLGYADTLQVTLEDMIEHCSAVRRGAPDSFIIADMPYLTYHLSEEQTRQNAAELIVQGKADAIKLEGGSGTRVQAIKAIVDMEIPVCAHLGLTPQSIRKFGGYLVQGKKPEQQEELLNQAKEVEKAGAFMLVLEGIPELLGKEITEAVSIPTIGIGAGRYTDGQVLVYHDLLGYSDMQPKYVKQYANLNKDIKAAIELYAQEVKSRAFPAAENIYFPIT
ncbi:MAG TPA: 3-methyl-2-oxobutanoate hydroxymethyltransferase [Candidatus Cloacimonas sp.]|nr:3-methyl-2-oxobutanoate hydroxymethyltransferase [Candidatus Cloacimonas sp.]HQO17853.1 3-methyl-2-oxobutanoate hydroxymethyltransferase [Candidatus Cloacimonas sp.]